MAEQVDYSVKSVEPKMDRDAIIKNMAQDIYNDQRRVTEESLYKDQMFIQSSKMAYRAVAGDDFQGTDEEAVKMGLDMASRFNYNITGMGIQLAKMSDASDEDKLAMLYIVDTLDKKDITVEGSMRFFRELGLDPMNYVFGRSVGAGLKTRAVAINAGKSMLREAAERVVKNKYVSTGIQGGAMEGKAEAGRQMLEIEAKTRDEFDIGSIAEKTTVGTLAGSSLMKGTEMIGEGVKKVLKPKVKNEEVINATNQ